MTPEDDKSHLAACGKMLWKTIDVKAAARSDDVEDCETSCSFNSLLQRILQRIFRA